MIIEWHREERGAGADTLLIRLSFWGEERGREDQQSGRLTPPAQTNDLDLSPHDINEDDKAWQHVTTYGRDEDDEV